MARALLVDAVETDHRMLRQIGPQAAMSVVRAWAWLRLCSFATITTLVARYRDSCVAVRSKPRHAPVLAVAAAYEALRPLLLTSRDRCLHDSLALTLLLATQGIASCWVLGVKVRPFGAHAWVQMDDLVLGDEHFRVGQFQPILVA